MHNDFTAEVKPASFAHLSGRGATAQFSFSPFPNKGPPVALVRMLIVESASKQVEQC